MSQKALDDLRASLPVSSPKVADRISAFVSMIADMVAAAGSNPVRASDLATVLRMDPDSIGALIATDPPEAPAGLAPATLNPPRQGMRDADPANVMIVKPLPDHLAQQEADRPLAEKVVNPPTAPGAPVDGTEAKSAQAPLPGSAGAASNDIAGPDGGVLGAPARNPSPKA